MASSFWKRFLAEEKGAITVDYVVLTAAVVALALAVGGTLYSNIESVTTEIKTELEGAGDP